MICFIISIFLFYFAREMRFKILIFDGIIDFVVIAIILCARMTCFHHAKSYSFADATNVYQVLIDLEHASLKQKYK